MLMYSSSGWEGVAIHVVVAVDTYDCLLISKLIAFAYIPIATVKLKAKDNGQ